MLRLIPTPIGNPADITIRAMRHFEEAELFLCEDTRNTKHLMRLLQERFGMKTPDAQYQSFHEHNGEKRLLEISSQLESKNVVYVSDAGMPVISDPGQLLVEYCQQHDIPYDILPGANAALTAFVASGFDDGKFCFIGFLPNKGKDRASALQDALRIPYATILYEAPHRLEKLLYEILELEPSRELFLAKELTKRYQKYYLGDVSSIVKQLDFANIRGEWVVVLKADLQQPLFSSLEEILALDIATKEKAKLYSQITNKSVKECYGEIAKNTKK